MRLFGYYVTSFNNGAYFLDRLDPLNAPYFTLHFLWGFPLTSPVIKRLFANPLLDSTDKWFYFPFLESDANIEFNNADGMFFPLMDYGVAGGLIYWLLIGVLCGWLYDSYRRKSNWPGCLLYPATFLGLIESSARPLLGRRTLVSVAAAAGRDYHSFSSLLVGAFIPNGDCRGSPPASTNPMTQIALNARFSCSPSHRHAALRDRVESAV